MMKQESVKQLERFIRQEFGYRPVVQYLDNELWDTTEGIDEIEARVIEELYLFHTVKPGISKVDRRKFLLQELHNLLWTFQGNGSSRLNNTHQLTLHNYSISQLITEIELNLKDEINQYTKYVDSLHDSYFEVRNIDNKFSIIHKNINLIIEIVSNKSLEKPTDIPSEYFDTFQLEAWEFLWMIKNELEAFEVKLDKRYEFPSVDFNRLNVAQKGKYVVKSIELRWAINDRKNLFYQFFDVIELLGKMMPKILTVDYWITDIPEKKLHELDRIVSELSTIFLENESGVNLEKEVQDKIVEEDNKGLTLINKSSNIINQLETHFQNCEVVDNQNQKIKNYQKNVVNQILECYDNASDVSEYFTVDKERLVREVNLLFDFNGNHNIPVNFSLFDDELKTLKVEKVFEYEYRLLLWLVDQARQPDLDLKAHFIKMHKFQVNVSPCLNWYVSMDTFNHKLHKFNVFYSEIEQVKQIVKFLENYTIEHSNVISKSEYMKIIDALFQKLPKEAFWLNDFKNVFVETVYEMNGLNKVSYSVANYYNDIIDVLCFYEFKKAEIEKSSKNEH